MRKQPLERLALPPELADVVKNVEVVLPLNRQHLLNLTFFESDAESVEVAYEVPGKGRVVEATVDRCKNGAVVNYPEPYMRRRDPEAMVIADSNPTDKSRYADRFGSEFDSVRAETFEWLKAQKRLIMLPFYSGDKVRGYPTVLVAPANAGFFVTGLADLQGFIPAIEIPEKIARAHV